MSHKPFVNLSVRSDMSVTSKAAIGDFAGSARVPDLVARAAELGQSALACTELGSLRGIYQLTAECEKAGITPIYGVEVYVCADHRKRAVPKDDHAAITAGLPPGEWRDAIDAYAARHGHMQGERDLCTLTLWALDSEGLSNLIALTSKAWIDGYYYRPRVDVSLIEQHSAGLACGTGSHRSWVMRPLIEGKRAEALERAAELARIFGERLYAEVMPHPLMVTAQANAFALTLAKRGTAKLLASGYTHYLAPGDLPFQKMLAAIGQGKGSELSSAGLEIDSYWLRSRDEMVAGLIEAGLSAEDTELACDETGELAAKCSARLAIDPFAMIIPSIETGELSHIERIAELCEASPKMINEPRYRERLAHELEQLSRPVAPENPATFASYILYVFEVCEMAKRLGIELGPGRGSAAGSLVNHLIGITDVDPIEHGLLFSRFIDPNRVGPPDIDIDVEDHRRSDLIDAMRERWGNDCVAQISNANKLKGRMVVNDVCRELAIPLVETRSATKHIEQKSDHDDRPFETVIDAFTGPMAHPECVAFAEKYPQFLAPAVALEGKLRALGTHAAGVVAAPGPLLNWTPLETRPGADGEDRVIVTAFDMVGIEQVGLLKIDLLGLKTVTTIARAFRAIQAKHGIPIGWATIPLDDRPTLDAFTAGDLTGVFQFDSGSARKLSRNVRFDHFGIIADVTALNRPGPLNSGMAEQYIERMNGAETPIDYCAKVSEITRDTFGVMVYQEQVMRVVGEVGGHENPDKMRKIIGKKLTDKIEAERPGFLAGAAANAPDMDSSTAEKLFDDIAKFGEYGFNLSHSVAYAKLGYIQQWLKVHYPLEFYWSLITTTDDKKRRGVAKDAQSRGIKLASPDISLSGYELGIDYDRHAIIGALSDVKGVGVKAAQAIVAAQPFTSFADFMERTDRRAVTAGTIKALATAGAFDHLLGNVRWFLEHADTLFHESKLKRFPGWEAALAEATGDDFAEDDRLANAASVNPMALESPYTSTLAALAIDISDPFDDGFMAANDGKARWFAGTLGEVKRWQQTPWGDREPTEAEAAHESHGAEYVSCMLELDSGQRKKLKIPWWVCRDYDEPIEDGEHVLTLAVPSDKFDNLGARLLIPLERLRTGEGIGLFSRFVRGEADAALAELGLPEYDRKMSSKDYERLAQRLHAGGFEVLPIVGIVTDVRTKLSGKREQEMADVGVLTAGGDRVEIRIFSSDWLGGWDHRSRKHREPISGKIMRGSVVTIWAESNEWKGSYSLVYSAEQGIEIHRS